ncbi:MAG: ATP-binding protein, partial [Verrucomicrobiota bacterium]
MLFPFKGAQASEFRQLAEEMANGHAARYGENLQNLAPEEIKELLHRLRVRQLELELENEALRQSQANLMNRDVSGQRLADDAQRQQTALISSLLDSLPDANYYKDLDYRSQFEQNSAMMLLIDRSDWTILDANHAAERFYGYPAGQLKTMPIYDLNTQAHNVIRQSLTHLKVNEGYCFETLHRLADGSLRDVEVCSSHIQFAGRSVNHSIIFDITPRKLAEAELARVSKIQGVLMHLATTFVSVPIEQQNEAIEQSLATMGQIIAADRAYLFAYDPATGAASNTHEWCAAGVTSPIRNSQNVPREGFEEFLAAHSQGLPLTIPSVAALPPGTQQRAVLEKLGIRSLTTLPLMQGNTCLGFIGFDAVRQERVWQEEEIALMRVLAELYTHFDARVKADRASRRLQQHLMIARDEAQAAAQSKSVFLANMSHEIRTPLNAILGYAQIMQLEDQESANNGRLRAISRSGDHLLTLIDNLLELVRSDNRAIELTPTDFDFGEMLEDVRLIFADKPETLGLAWNVIHAPDGPRFIHADQGKIRQILVNLVSNALKFTQAGSVNITTSVISNTPKDDLLLAIDVTDTGCGIRANELESIFELFVQSASGRNSGKGSGIGLHLSRRYARALGGDVTVTSQPGHGSCF